jgi:hypothetical protein
MCDGSEAEVATTTDAVPLRRGAPRRRAVENRIVDVLRAKLRDAPAGRIADVSDVEQLVERMFKLIPAPHPYDGQVGPFYETAVLAEWLGVSRQALNQRIATRSLLGCPTADGVRAYPVWQFQADGTTLPHLTAVLTELARGSGDPWVWATWLTARVPGEFGGRPAWQWLQAGKDPAPVLAAARGDAARWAS